jgi:hypothetical protein
LFVVVYSWYFIGIHPQTILQTLGYFRQFIYSQPDSQLNCQTVKLGKAAFPAQQLFLHSITTSHSQPATAQTNRPLDIQNTKFLLLCFEAMSGLKINFDKSEVVVLGYPPEIQQRIADNLNCRHWRRQGYAPVFT